MDQINVNQIVRVKLTEYGIDVFKEYYSHFSRQATPLMDKDGYTTFQLWEIMQLYGPHMEMANPKGVPFNTEIFIGRDDKFRVNAYLKSGAVVPLVYEDEAQFEYYINRNPIQDAELTIIWKSEVSYIRAARG